MNRLWRHRPSPALVVSIIALVVALGGTSYAAFSLPRNSVGTRQLKRGAVTTQKLRNGAVTGAKIQLGSLGTVPSAAKANTAGYATSAATAADAGHATTADTATSAGHATNADQLGGVNASAYQTLASGKTLTGSWGVGGGTSDWMGDSVQFRLPLAAPPTGSDYIPNAAAYTSSCPGPGRAAPGHLCVYRDEGSGTSTFSAIYNDEGGTSNAGAGETGFLIYFSGGSTLAYVSGDWAVTAP